MSDTGRKNISDQVGEHVTPDSQKSTLQQAKEGITGTADKVSRDAQPDSHKSTTQSMTDKMGREKDSHSSGMSGTTGSHDDKGVLDKAKDAMGMGDNKH